MNCTFLIRFKIITQKLNLINRLFCVVFFTKENAVIVIFTLNTLDNSSKNCYNNLN